MDWDERTLTSEQAINAALGGTVEPNPKGYENGLVDVAFTDEGKKFFGGVGMKVAEAEEDGLGVMQVHGVRFADDLSLSYLNFLNPTRPWTGSM